MGRRNEKLRNKFLESPTHAAMLRAIIPQAVFIPKCPQVKAQVSLQSAHLHTNLQALLDSGATDNFINPLTVERFNLPTIELPKSKVVCNVDGTPNRNGSITHATKLEVQYKNHTIPLLFLIMDMGSDSMLLGMPFLTGFSPNIDWKEGILLRSKGLKDATCMGWFGDDWDCSVGFPPEAMDHVSSLVPVGYAV